MGARLRAGPWSSAVSYTLYVGGNSYSCAGPELEAKLKSIIAEGGQLPPSGTVLTLTGAFVEPGPAPGLVTKRGGSADLLLQSEIMARAGVSVFPEVSHRYRDSYAMEALLPQPTPLNYAEHLARLEGIRQEMLPSIWRHPPVAFPRAPGGWKQETHEWLRAHAPHMIEAFDDLYANYDPDECLIHGDPTLSNLMVTQRRRVKMIDPAPPRAGLPQLKEVDLGKLLQSAMGWEHLTMLDWPEPIDEEALDYVASFGLRVAFWGAFHCLRVVVRYPDRQDFVVWGRAASAQLLEALS